MEKQGQRVCLLKEDSVFSAGGPFSSQHTVGSVARTRRNGYTDEAIWGAATKWPQAGSWNLQRLQCWIGTSVTCLPLHQAKPLKQQMCEMLCGGWCAAFPCFGFCSSSRCAVTRRVWRPAGTHTCSHQAGTLRSGTVLCYLSVFLDQPTTCHYMQTRTF